MIDSGSSCINLEIFDGNKFSWLAESTNIKNMKIILSKIFKKICIVNIALVANR